MNWIGSHRRVDKDVTVRICRMNRFLFAENWYCVRGYSQQGLQHAFDRFSTACDQAGTKSSAKKIEELCHLRRPRECFLQVSDNALQQVEAFKYLGVVFRSDESRNKRIDTWIGKANAVLRELCCSVVTKRELPKNANISVFKSVFLPILTMVMNFRWRLKEYCQKNKRQILDICEEFLVWHFVTKSTGLKSVKPGMSSHFSESRDTSYVSSAMCSERPRKKWRTKSFKLQSAPTGKRPWVRPRTKWHDYISDLAWSRLGVEPAELSEIVVDREVFRVLLGLLPPRLSQKKSGHENE